MSVKNSKQIILLDGAKGAGKSTVSHLLGAHLPHAIILSLDEERRALPDQEKTRSELNQIAFKIILEKTKTGLENGKSIVIDCGLTEERVSIFDNLANEGEAKIHKFFLKAPYETLLERVRGRDRAKGKPTDEKRFEEVFNILHSKDFTGFTIIETNTLTPQEISDKIVSSLI